MHKARQAFCEPSLYYSSLCISLIRNGFQTTKQYSNTGRTYVLKAAVKDEIFLVSQGPPCVNLSLVLHIITREWQRFVVFKLAAGWRKLTVPARNLSAETMCEQSQSTSPQLQDSTSHLFSNHL